MVNALHLVCAVLVAHHVKARDLAGAPVGAMALKVVHNSARPQPELGKLFPNRAPHKRGAVRVDAGVPPHSRARERHGHARAPWHGRPGRELAAAVLAALACVKP